MTPSLTPSVIRSALAQAYPFKPWLWDRPFHFLRRRAVLAVLERFAPTLRDAQWTLTLGSGARIITSPRDAEGRSIFTHGFSEYALAHLLSKMIETDWVCV